MAPMRRSCMTYFTAGIEPKPTKPPTSPNGPFREGRCRGRLQGSRHHHRASLYDQAGAPGLYRAACLSRSVAADGQCTIFSSSQGQFMVRAYTSRICGADIASIRAIPAEIGGGFGGKTIIYLEPLAYMLSKKSGRPVKMVMSREEVFRATGPTSARSSSQARRQEGRAHHRRPDRAEIPAGAFPGSPVQQGCICSLAVYDLPNAETIGYDVLCNRAKVAAYRAPGRQSARSRSKAASTNSLANCDRPLKLREINGAKEGTRRRTARPGSISAIRRPWRRRAPASTSRRRSSPARDAASPRATGTMPAANRARPAHQ